MTTLTQEALERLKHLCEPDPTNDPEHDCCTINAADLSALLADLEAAKDKIEGLDSDLHEAVKVAHSRGAQEWARLNYPQWFSQFEATPTRQALSSGEKDHG